MGFLDKVADRGLINPPFKWIIYNTQYLVTTGSHAYGIHNEDSDFDLYGFCIPPKEEVFPHLKGEIEGFGRQKQRFYQWLAPAFTDGNSEYDLTIYNIVKYVQLCMENNPNMIDTLFVPARCIRLCTKVGNMLRDERHKFLHKGSWHKFKGYAYSQLHKMDNKEPIGKRAETVEKYGYDVKFGAHCVRLLYEVEMILKEGTIDLERNREHLKAIRRGDLTQEEVRAWSNSKMDYLEKLYETSDLPYEPDVEFFRQLLLDCLEEHYGSLEGAIVNPNKEKVMIQKIREIVNE